MTDPWETPGVVPSIGVRGLRFVVTHLGSPQPQGRPRASVLRRGKKTIPILRKADASTIYESALAETARDAAQRCGWVAPDEKQTLGLWVDVYRAHNRGDLDNFVKAACDAFTVAGIWHDDRRVVRISARMFIDRERPRLVAVVRRVRDEG